MTLKFDFQRPERTGLPEAVFCHGKDIKILNSILDTLGKKKTPVLLTRLNQEKYQSLESGIRKSLAYDPASETAYFNKGPVLKMNQEKIHRSPETYPVAIITGGTSDSKVALEAQRTLAFMDIESCIIMDVGVAGLWRLQESLSEIQRARVAIVCAGMEASLPTVLAGLIKAPIIAVPISQGYGVAEGGKAALMSILASCAPGLLAVNIDNGFGAACAAIRILNCE
jgi:hypothetical protein